VFAMRLGIFASTGSPYARLLCNAAADRGHQTLLLDFESLSATVRAGRMDWQCSGHDLRTLDAAVVRTMPPGTLEQVVGRMDLLAGLEAAGVPIINPPKSLECAVDKYLTTQRLALAGVPVPDTVVCESAEAAMLAWEQLGGDVVVKPLFGAEGRGILRVTDRELAHRVFRTIERLGAVLYLQQFLRGPRYDLRLLLLDGQLLGAMQRIPRDGDFRANLSQQGTAVPWQPSPEELLLARRAAEITGAIFAGVDLMHRDDLQPVVIEVNAVPGWKGLEQTCGVPVAALLVAWIEKRIGQAPVG
jgi:RimK family alpha-L-glutamate ligase